MRMKSRREWISRKINNLSRRIFHSSFFIQVLMADVIAFPTLYTCKRYPKSTSKGLNDLAFE